MQIHRFTSFALLLISSVLPACAGTRHALVIGNDSYPGNELSNAKNDAKAIYESLVGVGYSSTLVLDANRATLSDKVDTFVDTLSPGDTAILYYAGHGFQLDGENFLVPTDFQVVSSAVAKAQGYSVSAILERFTSHGATTQIVILDACRNNPFLGSRSLRGGWAGLGTSAGSLLAFGTSPGSTASDDPGEGHGLFTKDLLKYLTKPDEDIESMLRNVREDVIRDSNGKQVPWVASSLIGTFHINSSQDVTDRLLPDISDNRVELKAVYDRSISATTRHTSGSENQRLSESSELSNAMELVRGEKIDAALEVLQRILNLNPLCSAALDLLGLIFHHKGRDLEAVTLFDRALAVNPEDPSAAAYKCAVEQLTSNDRTVSDCSALAQQHPSSKMYLLLATAEHSAGDDTAASRSLDQSISIEPMNLAYVLRDFMSGRETQ